MGKNMKNFAKTDIIGIIITVVLGLLLGFFGVFVSVFSDGLIYERLITILIVLIIYGILSIVLGFLKPNKTWLYMLCLSLPGALLLLLYMTREFNIFYLLYAVLILLVSYFGTKSGKSFKIKKK